MLIGIIQVKSWSQTFGAGFLSWTKTVADRMKRIAIRNSFGFHSLECFIKSFA